MQRDSRNLGGLDKKSKIRVWRTFDRTPPASILTNSRSVVSCDSLRIAFLLAALNDLEIVVCDVGNANLNAPCCKKIWFFAGPTEFRSRQAGMFINVVRALYGLKSSGASWRDT